MCGVDWVGGERWPTTLAFKVRSPRMLASRVARRCAGWTARKGDARHRRVTDTDRSCLAGEPLRVKRRESLVSAVRAVRVDVLMMRLHREADAGTMSFGALGRGRGR